MMQHVLVIEDDSRLARCMAETVIGIGSFSVEIVASEEAAIAAASYRCPDLIISDVDLDKGGRGTDAVAHIQAFYGVVPTIFVTGNPGDEQARGMAEAILVKPVTAHQLVSLVCLVAGEMTDNKSDSTMRKGWIAPLPARVSAGATSFGSFGISAPA